MFAFDGINFHNYSFAVIGLGKRSRCKVFPNRELANEYMYKLCSKHGLVIEKVWNDNHDKTYHCNNGVTFFIHRI
jgi:hypothetical protein